MTGIDTKRRGYDHSAIYYASDEELLAVAVPFLTDGTEAGESTVVSLEPARADLLRTALPRSAQVTYLATEPLYARPAVAIKEYRKLMAGMVAEGAPGIRIFGEVPTPVISTAWDWWARYEAAVNHAYDEFPLRSMCAYDTRTTPRDVLEDVARTHPFVATPGGGHHTSPNYVEPPDFLATPRSVAPYPIQLTHPVVELVDPTCAATRRALHGANVTGVPEPEFNDFVFAVNEIVGNALGHGRPPVRVRLWADPWHMVVTVHDTGAGPSDPFAGLLRAPSRDLGNYTAGVGLWLAHQLCSHVALDRDDDGFTVRLTIGNPHA